MKRPLVFAAAVALAAAGLTACGKVGDLEQPAPLWGAQAKADYAKKKAEQEARDQAAAEQRNKPALPSQPGAVLDPANVPSPVKQAPLPGTNDPFGQAPNLNGPG